MYVLNANQHAAGSRRAIRDALLLLMQTVPYQEISVTEICRVAGASRQTYYRIFEFKNDILTYHLDEMFQRFFEMLDQKADMLAQFRQFFRFLLDNRDFLRLAAQNDLLYLFSRTINERITQVINIGALLDCQDPKADRYVAGHIAATVCSLLSLWTEHGFEESPEWMADLAGRLLGVLNTHRDAQPHGAP